MHALFFDRLEHMLREPEPIIQPYLPGEHDPDDLLMRMDLTEAMERFMSDRVRLVARLEELSPADWTRSPRHAEYRVYSVLIMFRHMALHDFLHAYRIEGLLLRPEPIP